MDDKLLITEIHKLPETLKLEVWHFISFLKQQYTLQAAQKEKPKTRKAGTAKGKYTLANDFDAPLDDFKEYM